MSATCVRSAAAGGLADLLQCLADLALVARACDLRGHDDPDELSAFDHGETADLPIGHFLFGVHDVVVRADRHGICRHDFADALRLCIHAGRDAANDDVAIGDDADKMPAFDDWDRAA